MCFDEFSFPIRLYLIDNARCTPVLMRKRNANKSEINRK